MSKEKIFLTFLAFSCGLYLFIKGMRDLKAGRRELCILRLFGVLQEAVTIVMIYLYKGK